MSDEGSATAGKDVVTARHAGPDRWHVGTDRTLADYDTWSDERLVDGYRRNSRILREYGTDRRTIRALCAIEERLRARDIDPDEIVAELDD